MSDIQLPTRTKNITGRTFGRISVISFAGMRRSSACNKSYWNCVCSCGNALMTGGWSLINGRTQSCGCLRRENHLAAITTHGFGTSHTVIPEYLVWTQMLQRCFNSKCEEYHNYGGRGITVCERWRGKSGFVTFLSDIGRRPSTDHSIDRFPNNDGNYEPGNVRWATRKEQHSNRRITLWVDYKGERKTLMEWSNILGIPYNVLKGRIRGRKNPWTVEKAFTTPYSRPTSVIAQTSFQESSSTSEPSVPS